MRLLVRFLTVVAVLWTASPVNAGRDGNGGANGGVDSDVVFATVMAGVQHGQGPSRAGEPDTSGCRWLQDSSGVIDQAFFDQVKVVGGISYRPFVRLCPGLIGTVHWMAQVSPAEIGMQAALDVREKLLKPVLASAPSAALGIVKVGMWFWVDPALYRTVTAPAWIATPNGIVAATATAVPVRLEFDGGEPDGEVVACTGPGRVWLPEFGDEEPSDCMYTYRHSSAVDRSGLFTSKLMIVWRVSWNSNVGVGGDLGEVVTTSTQQMNIREIQALIVE